MVNLGFLLVGSRAQRAARCIVPLSAFLYACGDQDVTVPQPYEGAAEVVETSSSSRVFEDLPSSSLDRPRVERSPVGEVNAGTSVTPVAQDGALQPVTPTPLPEPGPDVSEEEEPGPAPLECSAITPAPASYELLEGFTSSEDFVFDGLGNYVGVDDDNNLVRVSRNRERALWAPKIGSTAGMGVLPDGSVVFCEVQEGALKRVYPNGAVTVVLGGLLYPNGLDIGPDGFVYVAENNAGRVRRVNPDTGEFTIVAMGLQGANGVAFSSDPNLLYVGSFEGSGVYKVEIPAPGELGQAAVFARTPGSRLRPPVDTCADQLEGSDCVNPLFILSKCQALSNVVDCLPVDPCPGLEEGEYCDHPAGGVCRDHRCDPLPTCDELGEGAACEDPYSGSGVCQRYATFMFCGPPNPCAGLRLGATCEDPAFGSGICQGDEEYLYCTLPNPCEGREDGVSCSDPFSGPGVCRLLDDEYTYCEAQNPCEGLSEGDACEDFSFGPGVCQAFNDFTYCAPPDPCAGLSLGQACEDANSGPGVCESAFGYTYCASPASCERLSEGAACEDPSVGAGVCQTVDGQNYCLVPNPCAGLGAGDACEDAASGPGVCYATAGGAFLCVPPNACLELGEGDPCEEPLLGAGTCHDGLCISEIPSGGGIDGLGVDACGNVYASEYVYGNLWRISPAGEMELLAQLPSSWIPNIKWGRGLGGFSSDVMYVADRDAKRLFGIYVGVPGVTEFAEMGQ
jgi:sugar lactone lactonase YvrE